MLWTGLNNYDSRVIRVVQNALKSNINIDAPFSLIVDETPDRYHSECALNILYSTDAASHPDLLTCRIFESSMNHKIITNAIVDVCNEYNLNRNNLTTFCTDDASYMIKSFETMCILFPNVKRLKDCGHSMDNCIQQVFKIPLLKCILDFFSLENKYFSKSKIRKNDVRRYLETFHNVIVDAEDDSKFNQYYSYSLKSHPPLRAKTRWASIMTQILSFLFVSKNMGIFESVFHLGFFFFACTLGFFFLLSLLKCKINKKHL